MKWPGSIRWRLQLWYGTLLAVLLACFGVTAHQLERAQHFRRIDEALRQRLPALVEAQRPIRGSEPQMREFVATPRIADTFDGTGEAQFYYAVWLRRGVRPLTLSSSAPADLPMPAVGDLPTRQRGTFREVFLFPGPGDCVLVGRDITSDLAGLRQQAWGMAGIGGAVLLFGLAVGGRIVVRALRPIGTISEAAERIARGELKRRIDVPDAESELGGLAAVLNATFARLDQVFTQQARFTSDAAHELRTPVTVVLMHAQNGIEAACDHPDHQESFAAIQRAAQRMRRLIESLLELARFDAGQTTLARDSVDFARVVADGLELVAPLAEERKITIRSQLDPAVCRGDAVRLGQVVANLLTNSIIHNREGGSVTVSLRREGAGLRLEVADDGPGIPAEELPHLFERFHRLDAARSSRAGGTGLGLAITRAIVQAHGGAIEARSTPGSGSVFSVQLPA